MNALKTEYCWNCITQIICGDERSLPVCNLEGDLKWHTPYGYWRYCRKKLLKLTLDITLPKKLIKFPVHGIFWRYEWQNPVEKSCTYYRTRSMIFTGKETPNMYAFYSISFRISATNCTKAYVVIIISDGRFSSNNCFLQ